MKTATWAASAITLALATAAPAGADPFAGPHIGAEIAAEDFNSTPDGEQSIALLGGWDFRMNQDWIAGAGLRVVIDGVSASETTQTPAGLLQTADVSFENQWAATGRIGRVFGDRLLVFAEGGFERYEVAALRTLRGEFCVPPDGCLISQEDFSFDEEMWTIGAGAEWALNDNWGLRGTYDYGDSDALERSRLRFGAFYRF